MNNNKLRGYVRPDGDESQVQTWGWPEMEVEAEVETNALGLTPDWYRQEEEAPVEEPVEEPAPASLPRSLKQFARPPGKREWPRGVKPVMPRGSKRASWKVCSRAMPPGWSRARRRGWPYRELVDQQMSHWQGLIDRLANPLKELDGAVEQQLIALVMQLARALIRHEAETSPRLLLEALKQGLALLLTAELGSL